MDFVYVAYANNEYDIVLNKTESLGINWFSLEEIKDSSFNTFPDVVEWAQYIVENY